MVEPCWLVVAFCACLMSCIRGYSLQPAWSKRLAASRGRWVQHSTATSQNTRQSASSWDNVYESKFFRILSEDSDKRQCSEESIATSGKTAVVLNDLRSGWGNGAHPTTRLCIDYVEHIVPLLSSHSKPLIMLDYGTGSGILSILATKLGVTKCTAVDIDEDTLVAAKNNAIYNQVEGSIDIVHTKSVYIGDNSLPLADFTVANILPGPLSRLVAPLWLLTKPDGYLCLSGMRPHELPGIRRYR